MEDYTSNYQSRYLDKKDDKAKETFLRQAIEQPYLLDIETFHKGFDYELNKLHLLELFDDTGRLKRRNTYGIICKLMAVDSKIISALKKFWVLQFSENAKTPDEIKRLVSKKYKKMER